MSLIDKLSLNRTNSLDSTDAPEPTQESNTGDSEIDIGLSIDAEVEESITNEASAEQVEPVTEVTQTADQVSKFGQSAEDIVNNIFAHTKISVSVDDPLVIMIQLIRQEFSSAQSDIKSFVFAAMMDNLVKYTESVKNDIKVMHEEHAQIIAKHTDLVQEVTGQALADFDRQIDETVKSLTTRLNEIKQTTEVLEHQKQFIVNDVYGKLNEKILKEVKENLTSELKRIANNENNKVNQQKNMLIGGLAGLFAGMIFAVFIGAII